MRKIPLTQGKVALVDDDIYDHLMQWKWIARRGGKKQFYATRYEKIPRDERSSKARQRAIHMHHEVLGLPGVEIDHINRNSLDNQRHNLRPVTRAQNAMNCTKRIGTSSQYLGVCYFKRIDRWGAQINIGQKKRHLGCFLTEIEAAKVRDKAAHEQYGEFAVLNFPEDYR